MDEKKPVNNVKFIIASRRVLLSAISISLVFGILNMQKYPNRVKPFWFVDTNLIEYPIQHP
jgi:hypothetical protein